MIIKDFNKIRVPIKIKGKIIYALLKFYRWLSIVYFTAWVFSKKQANSHYCLLPWFIMANAVGGAHIIEFYCWGLSRANR